MLRIVPTQSAVGAKSYYRTADYYSEGQELAGVWRGKAAARLGLSGTIRQADWEALCDNRHPQSHQPLTVRRRAERRVGYDFTFDVPKSVSLLYAMTGDERIATAFCSAVDTTMADIESEMQTRVRKGGKDEDRVTGNMVWGQYIHTTARPVNQVPDPHLHAHCFVFNATWDAKESRWKAGQFAGLKRDACYFDAMCQGRLARNLEELGLEVKRTRTGWDLAGLDKATLDKFSRRTAQIEAEAKKLGITRAAEKGELGAKTREGKQPSLSSDALRGIWRSRLTDEESRQLFQVSEAIGSDSRTELDGAARAAVDAAIAHSFERQAVVSERKLLTYAIKRAYGAASPEAVRQEHSNCELVTGTRDGMAMVTTREVLAQEQRMIDFARQGRGTQRPLGGPNAAKHRFSRSDFSKGQRDAVLHVLTSRDRVILVRGAAGTGKTTMMQEAIGAIRAQRTQVFAFAPSADASRGTLREKGFDDADTVARLLVDTAMQEKIRGQAIWVDEAGLVGVATMTELFDLADRLDARIVLSGDQRQHGSVERGDALRLLQTEAGLRSAEIREIQRQKDMYERLVRDLSEGRIKAGFEALDRLGWIKEVPYAQRYERLASDYVAAVSAMRPDERALVVSPTHREGERATQAIRQALREKGRLGTTEREFAVLDNADLTKGERTDPLNYTKGDVLIFQQNAKGHKKGSMVPVTGRPDESLPLDQASRFQLYHPGTIALAAGDAIRITRNGQSADGKRLNNGALYTVQGFTRGGDIVTNTGAVIGKDYRHLALGYVVTSHASQGKSVKEVFIAQSSMSGPASNLAQFYVSASRGEKKATIYTDDKAALLEAVSRTEERLSATEFVSMRTLRERTTALQRMMNAAGRAIPSLRRFDRNREEPIRER